MVISTSGPVAKPVEYPCLRILKDDALPADYIMVVLFTEPGVGTVVQAVNSEWQIGQHANHFRMESFAPFDGFITLQNG